VARATNAGDPRSRLCSDLPGILAIRSPWCLEIPGKSLPGGQYPPVSRPTGDFGVENSGYPGFFSCRAGAGIAAVAGESATMEGESAAAEAGGVDCLLDDVDENFFIGLLEWSFPGRG